MSKVEAVAMQTKPFRPTDYSEKAVKAVLEESYLICDVKKDGVRLNLCVQTTQCPAWVDWLSREGKAFPAMTQPGMVEPLDTDPRWVKFFNPNLGEGLFPEGFMLDAELILLDSSGNEMACKDTSGALRRKSVPVRTEQMRVYVFDIVPLEVIQSGQEYDTFTNVRKSHVEYQVAKLCEFFPEIDWRVAESYDVFALEAMPDQPKVYLEDSLLEKPLSLDELYTRVRERGEEGLVLKDPLASYRRSKCAGWWKMVPDDNEDGKVVGLVWGTKGLANEGKVIGFEVLLESGHVVNACKISRALMDAFTQKVHDSRYIFGDDTINPYHGHTARVTFMERYPDGSLRHPSFDCFRGISDPMIKE